MEELLSNKSRDVSWPSRIRLACDVAKGVKYLHSRNVMHRDLTSKVCVSPLAYSVYMCKIEYKISKKTLLVCIKYSMCDLIRDLISCCV